VERNWRLRIQWKHGPRCPVNAACVFAVANSTKRASRFSCLARFVSTLRQNRTDGFRIVCRSKTPRGSGCAGLRAVRRKNGREEQHRKGRRPKGLNDLLRSPEALDSLQGVRGLRLKNREPRD